MGGVDEGTLQVVVGVEIMIMENYSCGIVYILTSINCVCVCVCFFFPFILDIKFVGRTSRGHTGGRSHRIFHPPFFCGACLNFIARRIQPFLSPVDRVKSNFVY